jgi:hypothetical protein
VSKNAGRTTPEDVEHRWGQNVEKTSQKQTMVIKSEEQNYTLNVLIQKIGKGKLLLKK